MGGKNKGAQRTKNNARPSSSGRSAELLSSSVPHFSGLKHIGFVSPLLKNEVDESYINPDFQIVFKRLNKKDSTTKLKALQEFSELVKNSEPEAVKLILSIWCRVYNSLANDNDNRIREAVQNAHFEVISRDKKMIAPHLKQIIGTWFTSQFDTYPPAASASQKSFSGTFSPEKIPNCLVFCEKEILSHIKENILIENNSTEKNEEKDVIIERAIISSLQGYCMYLKILNTEQIQNCLELNNEITKNPIFLKYSKHNLGIIRATWYQVIGVILEHAPFLIDNKHIIPTIVDNLDESDPTVIPSLWETLILITNYVENWQSYVNLKKQFVGKLWQVLQKGGNGCAAVVYSHLITLLSKLDTLKDINFYDKFFEKLRSGLDQRSVKISRSEGTAVVTTIFECLQYVIVTNYQTNYIMCEKLINRHISDLILLIFTDNKLYNRTIIQQTAALVSSWSRKQEQQEYKNLLESLYNVILNAFEKSFNYLDNDEMFLNVIQSQKLFLLIFKKSMTMSKKTSRVKFATDDKDDKNLENLTITNTIDELYLNNLLNLVYKVLKQYILLVENKKSIIILRELVELIQEFKSISFLKDFDDSLKSDNLTLHGLVLKWLGENDLQSTELIDLVFLQYEFGDSKQKEQILSTIIQNCQNEWFGWCLIKAYELDFNNDTLLRNWLLETRIESYLLDIIDESLNNDWHPQFQTLFTSVVSKDSIMSKKLLQKFIKKMEEFFSTTVNPVNAVDHALKLTAFITNLVGENQQLESSNQELILMLFSIICNLTIYEPMNQETISDVIMSINSSIKNSYQSTNREEFLIFMHKINNTLRGKFNKNYTELEHFVNIIFNLIEFMSGFYEYDILRIFFYNKSLIEYRENIWEICKYADYVGGNFISLNEISKKNCNFDNINEYFAWITLKICIVSKMIENNYIEDENISDSIELDNLLLDLVLGNVLMGSYKSEKFVLSLSKNYEIIRCKLRAMNISPIVNDLKNVLLSKLSSESWFWSKAILLLNTDFTDNNLLSVYKEYLLQLEQMKSDNTNISILHLTQVFGKYINYDAVPHDSLPFIESINILNNVLHCDELDVQIAQIFGKIEKLREENAAKFLLENHKLSWTEFQEIIEIVKFLSNLIKNKFDNLTRRHWDLTVISLTSWVTNSLKLCKNLNNIQVQNLISNLIKLYTNINNNINRIKVDNPKHDFVCEWQDLFHQSIHNDFVKMWLHFTEQFDETDRDFSPMLTPFLQEFSKIIGQFEHKFIFNSGGSLPNYNKFLKRCSTLIIHSSQILQIWAYKMLRVLLPGLIKLDATYLDSNTYNLLCLEHFKEILTKTHGIANEFLIGFKLGEDSCQVEPFTDSFTYVFAYLLLWCTILELCERSPSELRFQYADWLKKDDLFKHLLDNLFKLMPMEVLRCSEGKSKYYPELFFRMPNLSLNDTREFFNSEKIEHLVCFVYASCLAQLPALVRHWWSECDAKVSQIVDRITSFYVSPRLCNDELADVMNHETKFKNMTVKVLPLVREVVAIYTVDEAQMELVITLPMNYPLRGPDVQCNRQIGGTSHKQWLMQLKKCLLHQNGRIWDGLSLWNCNLDKKFDGIDECYICFAVLHAGTYQLPKLSCHTCKKKFHSACLYKWFSTSNKSTCPICRNLF